MPALYAHNKFGKLVIPKLPDKAKETIKKYPDSFRIGLQGPDFLFFYVLKNKKTKLGIHLHHNDIHSFIKNAQAVIQHYGLCSPEFSYIAGFICHFTLDNACHPYIKQFMKETGCGHVEIEGDLEHCILTLDGHTPHRYPMDKLVPNNQNVATSMAPFFLQLKQKEIYHSLWMMRYIKKLFVAPGRLKRTLLTLAMKSTGHYKRLKGHIIMPSPNLNCRAKSEFLYQELINSIDEAVKLINNFIDSTFGKANLSGKFHRDFNGNYFKTNN